MSLLTDLVYNGLKKISELFKSYLDDETLILVPSGVFAHRISLEGQDISDVDRIMNAILSRDIAKFGKIVFAGYDVRYNFQIVKKGTKSSFFAKYKFPPESINYTFTTLSPLGRPQTIKLVGTNNYIFEVLVDYVRSEAYLLFNLFMKGVTTIPLEGIGSSESLMGRLRASFNYYREHGLIKLIMDDPVLVAEALLSPFKNAGLI